jgi:hypothetical protein
LRYARGLAYVRGMTTTRTAAHMFDNATATDPHLFTQHPGKGCQVCGKARNAKLHTTGSQMYFEVRTAEIIAERDAI